MIGLERSDYVLGLVGTPSLRWPGRAGSLAAWSGAVRLARLPPRGVHRARTRREAIAESPRIPVARAGIGFELSPMWASRWPFLAAGCRIAYVCDRVSRSDASFTRRWTSCIAEAVEGELARGV